MRIVWFLLLLVGVSLGQTSCPGPTNFSFTVYVSGNGGEDASGCGATLASACQSLGFAINISTSRFRTLGITSGLLLLDSGVYSGVNNTGIQIISELGTNMQFFSICGINGQERTIIDLQYAALGQAFLISAYPATIQLSGLTFKNANSASNLAPTQTFSDVGGVVSSFDTTLQITNCIFINNYATYAPAFRLYANDDFTETILQNTTFINNGALENFNGAYTLRWPGYGGAVGIFSPLVVAKFINCSFKDNSAAVGGAVAKFFSSWDNAIANSQYYYSTFIPIFEANPVSFVSCLFKGNYAKMLGSAVFFNGTGYSEFKNVLFLSNRIDSNTASILRLTFRYSASFSYTNFTSHFDTEGEAALFFFDRWSNVSVDYSFFNQNEVFCFISRDNTHLLVTNTIFLENHNGIVLIDGFSNYFFLNSKFLNSTLYFISPLMVTYDNVKLFFISCLFAFNIQSNGFGLLKANDNTNMQFYSCNFQDNTAGLDLNLISTSGLTNLMFFSCSFTESNSIFFLSINSFLLLENCNILSLFNQDRFDHSGKYDKLADIYFSTMEIHGGNIKGFEGSMIGNTYGMVTLDGVNIVVSNNVEKPVTNSALIVALLGEYHIINSKIQLNDTLGFPRTFINLATSKLILNQTLIHFGNTSSLLNYKFFSDDQSNLWIYNSTFYDYSIYTDTTPPFQLFSSNVYIEQTTFQTLGRNTIGRFMYFRESNVTFNASNLLTLPFSDTIPALTRTISLSKSKILFFNSSFSYSSGHFLSSDNSIMLINNSLFEFNQLNPRWDGLFFFGGGSKFSVFNCIFRNNIGPTLMFINPGLILNNIEIIAANQDFIINNCTFINNQYSEGGAISLRSNTKLFITNSLFIANKGILYGGAIYNGGGTLNISNCSFLNNQANINGGAISHTSFSYTNIKNSLFENNLAINGGAIDHSILGEIHIGKECDLTLENCTFKNNSASAYGGVVYTRCNCSEVHLSGLTLIGNFAIRGTFVFHNTLQDKCDWLSSTKCPGCVFTNNSPPSTSLSLLRDTGNLDRFLQGTILAGWNFTILPPLSLFPSQIFRMEAKVRDLFDVEIYETLYVAHLTNSSGQLISINQSLTQILYGGYAAFSGLSFEGIPNQNYNLTLTLLYQSVIPNLTLSIMIQEQCSPGEILFRNNNTNSTGCTPCLFGESNSDGGYTCYPCPPQLSCLGGFQLLIDSGYWWDSSTKEGFNLLPCRRGQCCPNGACPLTRPSPDIMSLSSSSSILNQNVCGPKRTGYRCNACQPNYYDWSGLCLEYKLNFIPWILPLIFTLALCFYILLPLFFPSFYFHLEEPRQLSALPSLELQQINPNHHPEDTDQKYPVKDQKYPIMDQKSIDQNYFYSFKDRRSSIPRPSQSSFGEQRMKSDPSEQNDIGQNNTDNKEDKDKAQQREIQRYVDIHREKIFWKEPQNYSFLCLSLIFFLQRAALLLLQPRAPFERFTSSFLLSLDWLSGKRAVSVLPWFTIGRLASGYIFPTVCTVSCLLVILTWWLVERKRGVRIRRSYAHSLALLCSVLQLPFLVTALSLVVCEKKAGGEWILLAAPSVACNHTGWITVSSFILAWDGLVFPIIVLWASHQEKGLERRMRRDEEQRSRKEEEEKVEEKGNEKKAKSEEGEKEQEEKGNEKKIKSEDEEEENKQTLHHTIMHRYRGDIQAWELIFNVVMTILCTCSKTFPQSAVSTAFLLIFTLLYLLPREDKVKIVPEGKVFPFLNMVRIMDGQILKFVILFCLFVIAGLEVLDPSTEIPAPNAHSFISVFSLSFPFFFLLLLQLLPIKSMDSVTFNTENKNKDLPLPPKDSSRSLDQVIENDNSAFDNKHLDGKYRTKRDENEIATDVGLLNSPEAEILND